MNRVVIGCGSIANEMAQDLEKMSRTLYSVANRMNENTPSLNKLIESEKYPDIKYGIKLNCGNIGFNGKFYTFPYFVTFLIKKWLKERR